MISISLYAILKIYENEKKNVYNVNIYDFGKHIFLQFQVNRFHRLTIEFRTSFSQSLLLQCVGFVVRILHVTLFGDTYNDLLLSNYLFQIRLNNLNLLPSYTHQYLL